MEQVNSSQEDSVYSVKSAQPEHGGKVFEHDESNDHHDQTMIKVSQEKWDEEEEEIIKQYKQRLQNDDNMIIFELFEMMLTKMNTIQDSIRNIKMEQKNINDKVTALESAMTYLGLEATKFEEEIGDIARSNIKLIQATVKCEKELGNVKDKVNKVETSVNKGCLTVSGISNSEGEQVKEILADFFKKKMKITQEIVIASAHGLGKADAAM